MAGFLDSPGPNKINADHDNDDVDGSPFSHHHTLGSRANQAAPGNHDHNGANSVALFSGFVDYVSEYYAPGDGIGIADGLKFNNGRNSNAPTAVSADTVIRQGDWFAINRHHQYLVLANFDIRCATSVDIDAHIRYRTVLMSAPEAALPVPPPSDVVLASDSSIDGGHEFPVMGDARWASGNFWRLYNHGDNPPGYIRFGLSVAAGALSYHKMAQITAVDIGTATNSRGGGLRHYLMTLNSILNRMGGEFTIVGDY